MMMDQHLFEAMTERKEPVAHCRDYLKAQRHAQIKRNLTIASRSAIPHR